VFPSWGSHAGSSEDQEEDGQPHVKDVIDGGQRQGTGNRALKGVRLPASAWFRHEGGQLM
jgi:hypothetical protein